MNKTSKIYFAGSIRGGRNDADRYTQLIDLLQGYGTVLTEHIGNTVLLNKEKSMSDKQIHDRDVEWLEACDWVCAEVTQPSLGVGYELAMAMQMKKPVLCLFYPKGENRLSAMITGQEYFIVHNYSSIPEAETLIKNMAEKL